MIYRLLSFGRNEEFELAATVRCGGPRLVSRDRTRSRVEAHRGWGKSRSGSREYASIRRLQTHVMERLASMRSRCPAALAAKGVWSGSQVAA